MVTADLAPKADRLRALHVIGQPLVLANAWDVESARTVEAVGAAAIATSSAAMAAAVGDPDDNTSPWGLFELVKRISAGTELPVTVDAEGGFGLTGDELVGSLLDAGAVGCNLEDTDRETGGLLAADVQAEMLAGVREASERFGVHLVINARIDTFVRPGDLDDDAKVADVVDRAKAYLAAGVDCVYPITTIDPAVARKLVDAIGAPVNVNGSPGVSIADLASAGAARVSVGAAPYRRMIADLRGRAEALFAGDSGVFNAG